MSLSASRSLPTAPAMARQDSRLAHTQALGVPESDPYQNGPLRQARNAGPDTERVEPALRLAGRAVEDHDGIRIVEPPREAKAAVRREVRWDRIDFNARTPRQTVTT
jgi:hypothetical protein